MPPSRRRPTPQPQAPVRRPRVAGLRRPTGPAPEQPEQADEQQPAEPVEAVDAVAPAEPTEPVVPEPDDEPAVEDTEDIWADEPEDEPVAVAEEDLEDADAPSPRPRPSGKRRAVGLRAPTAGSDLAEAERRTRTEGGWGPRAVGTKERTARGRTNLAIGVAVLALVCAGLAIFFRGEANGANDTADTDNTALTDTAATSQLIGELRPPIEAIFSVDYAHLDKTSQAANANLTGDALKQYNQLFGVVQTNAQKQKLVSTFKIREISVMSLRGDTAEVLVFADQTSNKPCDPRDAKVMTCGAAIGVPAQRVDGHWKIAGFDMFNAPPVG